MPAVIPWVVGGLATGAVNAGVQAGIAGSAKRNAEKLAAEQKKAADEQLAAAKQRADTEESQQAATTARDQGISRQRRLALGAKGRRDTILTGPYGLGSTGTAGATPLKTALGA